ncbi:XRE family transcriptional regulator [Acidaminococcus fermentans]|uniref:XRE family transcriptional regulator n=1 Tax=Acidaminococcus fermentans TaxID=905 RepID=UPI001E618763|nr:XRE family transcriptional regulator [Acidaminococcus fermentans]
MDAEMMENVRQNEKYYRMKAEVSAKQIGEITGHCESWIIMFEHGVIKTLGEKDIQKITKALGIRIKDLLQPAGSPVLSVTKAERRRGMKNLEKIRKHKGLTVPELNIRAWGWAEGGCRGQSMAMGSLESRHGCLSPMP